MGYCVAPLAGAWIETSTRVSQSTSTSMVAPLAGAWIETVSEWPKDMPDDVAPLAGAWIET